MTLAYTPPGVSVQELLSPNVSPVLSAPALICIVAMSQGFVERTDLVTFTGTTPQALPSLPAGSSVASVLAVRDAVDPSIAATLNISGNYRVTNDYTVNLSAGTVTRVAYDSSSGDGLIPDGRTCYVTYTYVPSDYFQPIRLNDLGSIADRFGDAWDGSSINSNLTYAAQIAFENGARSVVCQPLFTSEVPGDLSSARSQPSNGTSTSSGSQANSATWATTFAALQDIEDINVLVPVFGQSDPGIDDGAWLAIASQGVAHCRNMLDNDQYVFLLLGEDSSNSTTEGQVANIRQNAVNLRSQQGGIMAQQTALVNTSKFTRSVPSTTGQDIYIGGQYVAAAIAGMLAGRQVSQSLTREAISGLTGVADYRSKIDKNQDAQTGLLVVEQKGTNISVRHGVTLDVGPVQNREISVVRAKHRMIESLRSTIDSQIIGKVVADGNAATLVKTAVIGVLEQLKQNSDIVNYANVQARLLNLDPSTVEVRFSYAPAFPINYVNIFFSIDLSGTGLSTTATA